MSANSANSRSDKSSLILCLEKCSAFRIKGNASEALSCAHELLVASKQAADSEAESCALTLLGDLSRDAGNCIIHILDDMVRLFRIYSMGLFMDRAA